MNTSKETLTLCRFWQNVYDQWTPSVVRAWDKNGLTSEEIAVLKDLIRDRADVTFFTLNFTETHRDGNRETRTGHLFLTRGEAEAFRCDVTGNRRDTLRLGVESLLTAEVAPLSLAEVLNDPELADDLFSRIKTISPYSEQDIENVSENARIVWFIDDYDRLQLVLSGGELIFPSQWPKKPMNSRYQAIHDENGSIGIMDWDEERLVVPLIYRYVYIHFDLAEVSETEQPDFDEKILTCDILRLADPLKKGSGETLATRAVQGSLWFNVWVVTDDGGLRFMEVRHPDFTPRYLNAEHYDDVRLFHHHRAAVKKAGLWGYIDQDGRTIAPPVYSQVGFFNDGYAVVTPADSPGCDAVIDMNGNTVLDSGLGQIEHYKDDLFFIQLPDHDQTRRTELGKWAVYKRHTVLVDFVDIRKNVETELKEALKQRTDKLRKQIDTLDLRSYLALFPAMTGEKDLVDAGLWYRPVRVKKPVKRFADILKDSKNGMIGWFYPSSADMFDMKTELPVMFDKKNGETLVLGIPLDDLELNKGW